MTRKQNKGAAMEPEVVMGDVAITSRILTLRGVQVMLDRYLARIFGVSTSRLNEQVKRNKDRFPDAFMFQLSQEELRSWISQNATSNLDSLIKMGIRKLPHAFIEYGIIMLASVLKSGVAVATQKKHLPGEVAMSKFNKQNPSLIAVATSQFHDRFMILDGKELYHFGASLKDLGRHYCAVSKMDAQFIPSIMERLLGPGISDKVDVIGMS